MLIKGDSAIVYFMKITKFAICFLFLTVLLLIPGCNEGYDDSELTERVENRVQKLEEQMNSNISSLQSIMEALENNDYITDVTPIMEGGKEIGYTISFKKGNPITIYHGQNGNGNQGEYTPQIGVKQDTDGIYYWTLDGEWMTDESGNKIKAQGIDGEDGQDGITPQFKIENEYWWVSYDDGITWAKIGQATGGDVTSIFKSVTKNDKEVIFTLNDDTTIVIPIAQKIEISFDYEGDEVGISEGRTLYINYTLKNATDDVQVTASSDGNFVTKVEANGKTGGRISVRCINGGTDGYINVIVNDGNGYSYLKVINIYKNKIEFVNGLDYKISALGGDVMVPISLNFDYEVEVVEGDSWVTVNPVSRAEMRDEVLSFNVAQNSTSAERYAKIQLYNPVNKDEIYAEVMIGQSGREFSIEKNRIIFYNNGGTVETVINSTLDIRAEVDPSVSWLDATIVKSEGETSYKLIVVADAVSSSENRNAEISIYSMDGNILLGKFYVVQSGISDEDVNAMIVVTRANYSNDFTAYLPLYGDLDCYVDWGDGDIEYFKGYYEENEVIHKYSVSEPTSFDVKISGKVQRLVSVMLTTHSIIEVKQWGRLGLTSMRAAFSGSTILKSVPSDTFGAFENVIDFEYAFSGCSSLVSIPEGLFDNNHKVTSFNSTFSGCSSLVSIPEGLFDNCPNVTGFNDVFRDCIGLVSIPEGLFDNCPNVTGFSHTFFSCSSLVSIPEGLFDNNHKVTSFNSTFSGCSSLVSIPEGLFDNCPNVTGFISTFSGCSSLVSIPEGLFDNNRKVTSFNSTFSSCNSLRGESPYTVIDEVKYHLYERYKNSDHFIVPENYSYCFAGCSGFDDYGYIPSYWK